MTSYQKLIPCGINFNETNPARATLCKKLIPCGINFDGSGQNVSVDLFSKTKLIPCGINLITRLAARWLYFFVHSLIPCFSPTRKHGFVLNTQGTGWAALSVPDGQNFIPCGINLALFKEKESLLKEKGV